MPNIKSAKKRVEINKKKNLRNKILKSRLNTYYKKINALINENKLKEAENMLPIAYCEIDMMVTKGIIHKNNAANKKSKIASKIYLYKTGKKKLVIKKEHKILVAEQAKANQLARAKARKEKQEAEKLLAQKRAQEKEEKKKLETKTKKGKAVSNIKDKKITSDDKPEQKEKKKGLFGRKKDKVEKNTEIEKNTKIEKNNDTEKNTKVEKSTKAEKNNDSEIKNLKETKTKKTKKDEEK